MCTCSITVDVDVDGNAAHAQGVSEASSLLVIIYRDIIWEFENSIVGQKFTKA